MYIFEIAKFYIAQYLSNQLQSNPPTIFSVTVYIYKIYVFDEAFSLVTTFTTITEKLSFSYFHGIYC